MSFNDARRADHDSFGENEGFEVHESVDRGTNGTAEAGPGRGEMVGLALQVDALIARSDELGLDLVAYLLGVARAELGERLGERPGQRLGHRHAAGRRSDMPPRGTNEGA